LFGVKPNYATFVSILSAFATMGPIEEGMDIHQKVVKNGFEPKFMGISTLIDMYAKYGRI